MAVCALAPAACSSADEPVVREVAAAFATGDAQARCDLLAPATLSSVASDGPCPEALAELPLGSGDLVSVQVWGEDAQVHLTDDTLFLTRTDAGWRVSAGACAPAGADLPYECELEAS